MIVGTLRFHGNLIRTPTEYNFGLIVMLSTNQNWVILLSVLKPKKCMAIRTSVWMAAIHFFVNFDIFKWLYLAYYWVYLHQTWGFCKTWSALSDYCGSIVANPIIYRLVLSPSRMKSGNGAPFGGPLGRRSSAKKYQYLRRQLLQDPTACYTNIVQSISKRHRWSRTEITRHLWHKPS